MNLLKLISQISAIVVLSFLYITTVYFNNIRDQSTTYPTYGIRDLNQAKIVLLWNRPGHISTQPFHGCPHMCLAHGNRRRNFENNDAVIFSTPKMRSNFVPEKPNGQVWIFQGHESPLNYPNPFIFKKWRNLFNWTMTYRRDSDILFVYYGMRPKQPEKSFNLHDLWLTKPANIVIAVSNCRDESKRLEYLKIMRKYTKVDIYGRCGQKKCYKAAWDKCMTKFNQDYKFYLAFENSLCIDYVTEKFYKVYQHNSMVPVVRGGASYKLFAPPKSFISTSDFENIQSLTDVISNISSNYNSYKGLIDARKQYGVYDKNWYCEICKRLHNPEKYKRLYDDSFEWNFGNKNFTVCRSCCSLTYFHYGIVSFILLAIFSQMGVFQY